MTLKAGVALFTLTLLVALSSGCATTTYTAVGQPDFTVEGIEFYKTVQPTRPYIVLGVVEDTRQTAGGLLTVAVANTGRDKDVARKAIAAGGNAVLLESANTETTGARVVTSAPDAAGNRTSHLVEDQHTTRRFLVVKWK